MKEMKTTLYETITQQVVEAIEAGAGAYKMPWHARGADISSPRNAITGRAYRGLNVITLWMTAEAKAWQAGQWATYQQWHEAGAQVRKGEKATTVFFWKQIEQQGAAELDSEEDNAERHKRFFAKAFSVFNADQVDGFTPVSVPELPEKDREIGAEAFFAALGANIRHGGDRAFYTPGLDYVQIPAFEQFKTAAAYYGVLAHECTHWSGAKHRLARDLSGRFGSDCYAMEELVAELGAAFVSGHLALPVEPRRDHAPYIASWLKVLKQDSRAIFTAASKAQAAADYLIGFTEPAVAAA
jgi:antirestriction protein ArdC